MEKNSYVFTSESVTEGHPDKVCDQIADAILDEILTKEAALEADGYVSQEGVHASVDSVRSATEVMATEGQVFLAGEIRTQAYVDFDVVVRKVIEDIGYNDPDIGFHHRSIGIMNTVHEQSPDIAQGVDGILRNAGSDPYDLIGAGDQGMVFGYACTETSVLMPLPIFLAHRLCERLTEVRKNGSLPYLRPDGKTQVSVCYEDGLPQYIHNVLISTQHQDGVDIQTTLRNDLIEMVIQPVFDKWEIPWDHAEILVNPTGRFVVGGPAGDTGLTGRKIIVDTYGGMSRHGGGAFSGKDCTKVDRSGSYTARWIAKNVVAAGLATRCEVQIAYAIGMANPISLMVETFGTNTVQVEAIEAAVRRVFDLRPAAILDTLELRRPIFRLTSNYGHFGRELDEFTWEKTSRVDELKDALI